MIKVILQRYLKKLLVLHHEIASDFGVNLGGETTSRVNGSVGGEITKRLVAMAQQSMGRY
jgi:Small, acid-soluble spore proteins, alpha/beta type